MEIRFYDIGLNLFSDQFKDPDAVISAAEDVGVKCILTGSDRKENKLVVDYVNSHDVYGTTGIHPHNVNRAAKKDLADIRRYVSDNKRIVAVGECGLDYDRMFSTKENQLICLEHHIEIAAETGKPMFLHEREAHSDMVGCFSGYPEVCRRSVIHCFTGKREVLEKYLDMGFYIGITGWICDERRGAALRDAVKILPLDRVLLETDAPYLTPRNVKKLPRTNVPQNIVYVAEELAKNMEVSVSELEVAARKNTEHLFGIGSK